MATRCRKRKRGLRMRAGSMPCIGLRSSMSRLMCDVTGGLVRSRRVHVHCELQAQTPLFRLVVDLLYGLLYTADPRQIHNKSNDWSLCFGAY